MFLLVTLCYPFLPLFPLVTLCSPMFLLVTLCYPFLPLFPLVTPCSPMFLLVTPCSTCFPLLSIVTPVPPVTSCSLLLPLVTPCSSFLPFVTPCYPWFLKRPISANAGLKFCSVFVIYCPMYCLEQHFVSSALYFGVKAQ